MKSKQQLSRREREKLQHRKDILQTALGLFCERGFHNVSMHEIAQKAEFAIGTLYKFFKSKEDLYRSIMLDIALIFNRSIKEVLLAKEISEVEKLRNYVRTKAQVFKNHSKAIKLFFAEVTGISFTCRAKLSEEIKKLQDENIENLKNVFEMGLEKGVFENIADPYYLAVSLHSITTSFLFLELEAPEKHPYPDNPDAILNIFFKNLLK